MRTIEFKGQTYPEFQATGFAARFAFPFAQAIGLLGEGYDIGCNRMEWCYPGAMPIDPAMGTSYSAYNLPEREVDYIFSSHCLEHLSDWVGALDYWESKIKSGGTIFLYLPHPDQRYWLPWHNRKHNHVLYPRVLEMYFKDRGCWKNIFVSDRDLNHSYVAVAEKK